MTLWNEVAFLSWSSLPTSQFICETEINFNLFYMTVYPHKYIYPSYLSLLSPKIFFLLHINVLTINHMAMAEQVKKMWGK